ncbi:glucan phosphoethanolaminetransferase (alkaline phosphatase superfamily) [Sporosarcina luteola]|nr:glucan phosphoethanolaminetransferase (alkaline phosphatase superfamily) [Sporosarcina luteola]
MRTVLIRSVLGIFFGSFLTIMTIFAVIYFGGNDTLNSTILVNNALGTMFCGWFFTVTPLLFENEKLTLPVQTVLHFLCVSILYFIIAFGVGWVPFSLKGFFGMLGIFVLLYSVIWFSFYMYFKNEAKKLNEELKGL